MEPRELCRFSKKRILVVLIVCGKSVLMDNHDLSLVTAGICEVGMFFPNEHRDKIDATTRLD